MTELSAAQARAIFDYDPATGALTWRTTMSNKAKAGAPAGGLNICSGYLQVRVLGRLYRVHRLVWLWMTGAWPAGHIDHINGCKGDNQWRNLRDVTPQVNSWNRLAPSRSSTGLMGVTMCRDGRAMAQIMVSGKNINLGRFDSPWEAHQAYLVAKKRFHADCYFSADAERTRMKALQRMAA